METCFVARDNSGVLTVKLGRETSLVAYSTDKRSILKQKPSSLTTFPEIYLGTFLMFLSITFIMFFDRLFGIKHNSQMMSCPDLTM